MSSDTQKSKLPPTAITEWKQLDLAQKYKFYDLETNQYLGVGTRIDTGGPGGYSGASEIIYYVISPTLYPRYPIYITHESPNINTEYLAYNKTECYPSMKKCESYGKAYALPTFISRIMPQKKGGKKSRKARNKRRRTRRRHSRK